ncbi:MAG: hypothetical protein WDZ49_11760 [Litorilinea sp.]
MAINREDSSRRRGARGASVPKRGPEWWVSRWQNWTQELGLVAAAGAPSGARIKRLEIGPGVVSAVVQARNEDQCQVEIRFTPWTDIQWEAAMDAIGEQALFAAQLLAGELPPELDTILADADAPLLPTLPSEVKIVCEGAGCGMGKCTHATLIFAQLGEALSDDPWMLLRMRGRDQTQVLAALRKVRTKPADNGHSAPPAAPSVAPGRFHRNPAEATAQEEVSPLHAQMSGYWGVAKTLEGYRPNFHEPKVDAVLLRRLGPLPFSGADDDIYEDLTAIYRRVSSVAMRRAFATEPDQAR